MALGPQIKRKTREQILAKAEKIIDKYIKNDIYGDIIISIGLLPAHFDSSDWDNNLKTKYKQAGWKIASWVSDERDGDYIHLVA